MAKTTDKDRKTASDAKKSKLLKSYVKYTGLAFQMLGVIAAGAGAGFWLDNKMTNRVPVFTLLGTVFSLVAIVVYLIRQGE